MYQMYSHLTLAHSNIPAGTGWLPPMPDSRDYLPDDKNLTEHRKKLGLSAKAPAIPSKIDLSNWCSPIESQGAIGSCTANASVGVIEYFERRAFNNFINGSRLFVYKTTRNLLGVTGDTGALLRNVMGALVLCGVPDEKYWPYTDQKPEFDEEPTAFVYSVADNYEALKYFSHDPLGAQVASATVLGSVKQYLAAGIPSMFGFWGFPSFNNSDVTGGIPLPAPGEKAAWGHAIVAIGYDDNKKIKNTQSGHVSKGALRIRNSWGTSWGDQGYGWMPYEYVLNKYATDFWSLLSMKWLASNQFGLG